MKSLLRRRRFSLPARAKRSRAAVGGLSPERLEQRIALAADSAITPVLDTSTSVFVGESLIGPSPVVFGKSEITGNDVTGFVVTDVPEGSVVEKWDPASGTWVDVSTEPTSANPVELMQLLANRVIEQGDQLRWIPAAGTPGPVAKAFEVIGWDDGTPPTPPDPSVVPSAVQNLATNWTGSGVPSSALPRLSLTDNLIYTILVESSTTGQGRTLQTTVTYSFAAVHADTGEIVGTPLEVGSNTFSGTSPNYANLSSYTWNTLQMTGVISPSGVFYQGTAGGIFLVRRAAG